MLQKISPSMMCADNLHLRETIEILEKEKIEYLHIDIMDGDFVPNFQLGSEYIRQIRNATSIPLDIHLMINRPDLKLDFFGVKEGDYVSVHYESTPHVQRTLEMIKAAGGKPMLAINPATPINVLENLLEDLAGVLIMTVNPGFAGQKLIPQTLEKVAKTRELLDSKGYFDIEIEVDGNVSFENIPKMKAAGANMYVAGTSSIFTSLEKLSENINKVRNLLK